MHVYVTAVFPSDKNPNMGQVKTIKNEFSDEYSESRTLQKAYNWVNYIAMRSQVKILRVKMVKEKEKVALRQDV